MKKIYILGAIASTALLAGCGMRTMHGMKSTTSLPPVDEQNIHMCLMGGGTNCATILDPHNKSTYGAAIKKVCDMMPMKVCTTYFSSDVTADDISSLPTAVSSPLISLASGDTYTIHITEVKKDIGGKRVKMLSYNGSIPGPTIQAPAGAHVTIDVINDVPHLETTLHSHGVRLSDLFDGVPATMMGKQDPIVQGGHFRYEIVFPDAGLFRYHPHIDEQIQQELGLYGNFLVTPPATAARSKGFDTGHVLVFDDIQLDDKGQPSVASNSTDQTLMGRYGTLILTNGSPAYAFHAPSHSVVRLYMTNVANVRPMNITIQGAQIKLVGSDIGAYEKPTLVDHVLIGPAERYIVDVLLPSAGDYTIMNSIPGGNGAKPLATIHADEASASTNASTFTTLTTNTDVVADIDRYRSAFAKPADKSLTIDMTMQMDHGNMEGMGCMGGASMGSDNAKSAQSCAGMGTNNAGTTLAPLTMPGLSYDPASIEWNDTMQMMNEMSNNDNTTWKLIDDQTKKENMDIHWSFTQGDMIKVHITNKKTSQHPMQHPIHFHGQRFLVLTHNGVQNTSFVWKDTVLLGAGDTADILIDMSNPGTRMAHCHIAEHLMNGMMLHFDVVKK